MIIEQPPGSTPEPEPRLSGALLCGNYSKDIRDSIGPKVAGNEESRDQIRSI